MILRIACLALALPALSGCGLFSRQAEAFERLQAAAATDDVVAREALMTEARGLDPTMGLPWIQSAVTQPDGPSALAVIDRALTFDPANPELHLQRITQLARSGDTAGQLEAIDTALRASPWGAPVEGLFREIRVEALLALGDLAGATQEMIVYGGLGSTSPTRLSTGWAQIALVAALQGDMPAADDALDLSLDQGPDGIGVLRRESLRAPELGQAAALLVERASERHLDHPDLLLYRVVDWMLSGDVERAEAELSVLPRPLPARLEAPVEMVGARIDIAAGRIDEGLATLTARLDRVPADPDALNLLLASFAGIGQPSVDEVRARLERAIASTRSSALRRDLQGMLEQLPASDV